jgi:hypothetical protein
MTCIIGIIDKENNCVFVGGDSAGTSDTNITPRKDTKVFKVDDFIFGCTESFRMIQLLRFSLSLPKVYDTDIYEYMCTKFISSVRECFREGGFLQAYLDVDEKGGTFIVGYKNRLFTVYDDFQVEESLRDFASAGSGSEYALGAMQALRGKDGPKDSIIEEALEITAEFCTSVTGPFNILNTKE